MVEHATFNRDVPGSIPGGPILGKGDYMKLIIDDYIYELTREQCNMILSVMKKYIKRGIYAVEKDGIIELKKDKYPSSERLRIAINKYKENGFKVYYNGFRKKGRGLNDAATS